MKRWWQRRREEKRREEYLEWNVEEELVCVCVSRGVRLVIYL